VLLAAGLPALIPTAAQAAACGVPTSATLRGKLVDFDQCYDSSFMRSGTTYEVHVYYTEQNTAANQARCTMAEGAARCEHAIANADDASGDNLVAIAIADEAAAALSFYLDKSLSPIGAGTELNIYVGEDPRGGGVITPNSLYWDDELVDNGDVLWKRLLAYHEEMHLVQDKFDNGGVGWQSWYGEGIARAIEDRVVASLDTDTGHLFIPEVNGHLASDAERTDDFVNNSYRSVLWWTWMLDRYRQVSDTNPVIGWQALRQFYLKLNAEPSSQVTATQDFLTDRGSSWANDFVDYALALYAFKYNPTNERLGFLDTEIKAQAGLSGHNTFAGGPAFATQSVAMNFRSSRYFEFNPANQCDYTAFTFDGGSKPYSYSVMTVDGGNLTSKATATGTTWARTVRTDNLDRIVGVVTSVDQTGSVTVGRGCVTPTVTIKRPTTSAYAMVGTASNPRKFIVRLHVTGQDGSPVAGLTTNAFQVKVRPNGVPPFFNADIVSSAYVQDDYWLLVQAPNGADGAVNGAFHDLRVKLGTSMDTKNSSLLYVEQTKDAVVVLDRSGSMADSNKIAAARNAASLFVNEMSDDDAAGYVAFDQDPYLRHQLALLGAGTNREDIQDDIALETPGGSTSIGDGMNTAATEHDARKRPDTACSFILLSDGQQNEPALWETVRPNVIDNGCQMHVVALGPGANETLMQQIASSVPGAGGSYDYADVGGVVPVGLPPRTVAGASGAAGVSGLGRASVASGFAKWQTNLSRVYDYKATEAKGRQRIFAAIGPTGPAGATLIDFEDLKLNTTYVVGNSFTTRGVPVTGAPFFFSNGTPTNNGFALVDQQGAAGGDGHELTVNNINLVFGFGQQTASDLSFLFGEFGGNVNLGVNGDLRNAQSFADLDGQTIGGVRVSVEGSERGQVKFDGPISELTIGGQELFIDDMKFDRKGMEFFVDPTSDMLVVSTSWQTPDGIRNVQLIDPHGVPAPIGLRRPGANNTNDVWEVPNPDPGVWRLNVTGLTQEFYSAASVRTHYELFLFTGTPVPALHRGVEVPIVAIFAGKGLPLPGAHVVATVRDPDGNRRTLTLLDDGSHDDSAPQDGVYGGRYTATSFGDQTAPPDVVVDGSEPAVVGSYLVNATAVRGKIVRDAQTSFALSKGPDGEGDGLPDDWERRNGLDPKNKADGRGDPDHDGLDSRCEFQLGTRANNADTDGGGESDGSEAGQQREGGCAATGVDPTDPSDDRVGRLLELHTEPGADGEGPFLLTAVGSPEFGEFASADIYRTASQGGQVVEPRRLVAGGFQGGFYADRDVQSGLDYRYEIVPTVIDETKEAREGAILTGPLTRAKSDPYAPAGLLIINGGARTTASKFVSLQLTADDSGPEGDGGPTGGVGTPTAQLMMRLSNTGDFRGVPFRPFKAKVTGWNLGPLSPGEIAEVHVQFRDAAGNISTEGFGLADSIVFRP
jgi:hypothetical protein